MAKKTGYVNARIDPQTKERAEKILKKLGIKSTDVINALYRQIIMRKGIPFELSIPDNGNDSAIIKDQYSIWDLGKNPVDSDDGITDGSVNHDKYIYS